MPAPRLRLPSKVNVAGAKLLERLAEARGPRAGAGRASVDIAEHWFWLDARKAERELGFAPATLRRRCRTRCWICSRGCPRSSGRGPRGGWRACDGAEEGLLSREHSTAARCRAFGAPLTSTSHRVAHQQPLPHPSQPDPAWQRPSSNGRSAPRVAGTAGAAPMVPPTHSRVGGETTMQAQLFVAPRSAGSGESGLLLGAALILAYFLLSTAMRAGLPRSSPPPLAGETTILVLSR